VLSEAPDSWQRKLVIAVDDCGNGLVQLVFCDVPLIDKGDLPPIQTADGARGLRRTEIEAIAEGGDKITLCGIFELAVKPGDRPKVSGPMQPLFGIGEDIENSNRRHPIL
jgi:hypothetical protein